MVAHSKINRPHLEYINGMFVFFLDNNTVSENGCNSEYTRLGISNNNQIATTKRIKDSVSCHQNK
jgi:hypothetical protein